MTAETLEAATTPMQRAPARGDRPPARWRGWLVVGLIVAAGAAVIVLASSPPAPQYLSPASVAPDGTHALADVLAELGRRVQTQTSVPAAVAAATAATTLVITSPASLSPADIRALARVPANVVLVGPDTAALAALAPGILLKGPPRPVIVTQPDCTLPAAVLAGAVDTGGESMEVFSPPGAAQQCYPSASGSTLVQSRVRGRLVTVLGAADLLTNADLARQGNAALALNLLPTHEIVWLIPPPTTVVIASPGGHRSFFSLVPLAAYLVAAQLGFALLLAVGWRSRRLRPARHRAAASGGARSRNRSRARTALPLPARQRPGREHAPDGTADPNMPGRRPAWRSRPDSVVPVVAQRSGAGAERVRDLLYGPAPRTDGALATLARELDDLAREVGIL